MTITHKLTLDLQRKGELQRIDVVQGDAFTRQVQLELLCGEKPWNIPVCTPVVRYSKPDGTEGIYDTLPDGMPGVTYSENTLTLELAPQMLTCAGPVQVQVELNLEDRRLATFTFMLAVEPGVALAGKSEDYVNWTKAFLPQTTGAKVGQYVLVSEVDSAGQIIRVVAVDAPDDAGSGIKSVNGVLPDENGNVQIPVSGGAADLTGYATEQFVQDGFQPKGDYLPSEELPNAVNDALAQAKESGEFDGENGLNGLSILTVNITAGDAETIKVYADNVIENEGAMFPRDIQIGDKVLTEDGKIFLVESWGLAVDSSTGTSVTHYNAKFLINAEGSAGGAVTVPQAVVDGASAVVNRALSRGTESVLRFIAFSDAHQKNDDVNITAGNKELGMAIGEIVNRMGVSFISNLGDSGWSAYANTTEEVREQIKTLNSFIQPHIKGEQQLNAEGNHDDSVYSIIDSDGDGVTSSTEKFSLAETYALIWAKNRDVVYDPDHAIDGYCYKDFGHIKTRVICLNTEQGTGDGGVIEGYQLKWFAETALNMTGKADWNVVTLAHHPLDWGNGSLFKDCVNIVDAFINGSNFSYTTTDGTAIAADYSNKNCQYVGHFHGHTHAFSIVRMTKYVSSNYVDMKAWQIGIPNACYTRNNHNLGNASDRIARFSTPTTYDKSNVDGQRTSFNLVSVDLDNKIIYADNYGAGIDRQVAFTFAETVYTITNALTNCTSSNSAANIAENASYSATITPKDGYEMSSITVTMGGTDVTASVVNGKEISIANVTGNIVITAVAEAIPVQPAYTNQIPVSTDTDGSVYNGKGFKEDTRIETSGATGTRTGIATTGFIPIGVGSANTARGEQVIYLANIDAALDSNTRIAFYKSDKTFIGLEYAQNLKDAAADPGGVVKLYTLGEDGFINKMDFTALTSYYKNAGNGETAFFRIGAPGLDGDSIITVNEPIE